MFENKIYNITELLPMLDSAISQHGVIYGSKHSAKNKLIQPNLTFTSPGVIDILENELTFNH